ncbi:hypothetical protein [Aminipila terrae]|uniref:DegT/DnrJ/EryC1/StrS aminotransferase family protein n=1 Tax=Aminipila terrae TaxID=2697030 RepID=A0A6P1ME00_9FIRM|nr:hypothetical protein [Aminipila terrae]QHI72061.1 hypothetical protein Ami3637_06310 [Aminipila terrae]
MKEYGGYLPLELPQKQEYYISEEENMVRLNCGRSAISYAISDARPSKVFIPYYNCHTVLETLERLKVRYELYSIDEEFMPKDVELREDELLLYVNYYGIISRKNLECINKNFKNVIFDNTQAFFSKPFENAYNVYSCRKFFGVSDGAYLIKDGIKKTKLQRDNSFDRIAFMAKCVDCSTNDAYHDHLANEAEIAKGVLAMSKFTKRVLESIDYESVKAKRVKNFGALKKELGTINKLNTNIKEQIPMVYPLVVEDKGLREKLVKHKIYIQQWWKCVLDFSNAGNFEKNISEYLFPIPIDQRYNVNDMRKIANIIKEYLRLEC